MRVVAGRAPCRSRRARSPRRARSAPPASRPRAGSRRSARAGTAAGSRAGAQRFSGRAFAPPSLAAGAVAAVAAERLELVVDAPDRAGRRARGSRGRSASCSRRTDGGAGRPPRRRARTAAPTHPARPLDPEQALDREPADRDDQRRAQELELPVAPELAELLLAGRRRPVAAAGRRPARVAARDGGAVEGRVELVLVQLEPAPERLRRRGRARAAAPRPRRSRAPGRRCTRAGRRRPSTTGSDSSGYPASTQARQRAVVALERGERAVRRATARHGLARRSSGPAAEPPVAADRAARAARAARSRQGCPGRRRTGRGRLARVPKGHARPAGPIPNPPPSQRGKEDGRRFGDRGLRRKCTNFAPILSARAERGRRRTSARRAASRRRRAPQEAAPP